jgi:DNA-binding LacI/PurR family transcriptional regulator
MLIQSPRRYTIGFLSSWHVYEGGAMEPFSHALIRGVCSAASDFACNLLLACGVGPQANERAGAPAWPSLAEKSAGFVPVGPWNTDGLVVLPTELTPDQSEFLQLLRARGFPIVFAGPGEIGASVVVDNAGGIQQAVEHLAGHGRRRIAFIAGLQRASGDSAQRYAAYLRALADSGLDANPALTAYGLHSYTGGQNAMHQILSAGVPFDAVIASNDRSAMGAISVLNEQGKRVPEDVALIGFDDIPESKAWSPALTTIRNAEFVVGYQAALHLLEIIEGRGSPTGAVVIPVPLIVRQSCGCAAQTSGILPGPRKVERRSGRRPRGHGDRPAGLGDDRGGDDRGSLHLAYQDQQSLPHPGDGVYRQHPRR